MNNPVRDSFAKSVKRDIARPRLCFGEKCFSSKDIIECQITEVRERSHIYLTASVTLASPNESRWDYRSEASLYENERKVFTGVCVKSQHQQDGHLVLSFHDLSWHLSHMKTGKIAFFGMTSLEIVYWLSHLSGQVSDVQVEGLKLDDKPRPFLYAIPLKGLTAVGGLKSLGFSDLGIVAGDMDNVFAPLLAHLGADKKDPVWHPDVPKAFGMVLATGLLEAEQRAFTRARLTADIMNLALRAGGSHFETRYLAEPLSWNEENVQAEISIYPWILIREYESPKGWVHSIPLIKKQSSVDLGNEHERVKMFVERFLEASFVGDLKDQTQKRIVTKREHRLAMGVQRALRWYGKASSEQAIGDQFLATWIALESVLGCMEYPKVFTGDRSVIRQTVTEMIDEIQFPQNSVNDDLLSIDAGMLKNRLLQNTWPLQKKMKIFARSFGIDLFPEDLKLIGDLGRIRGRLLHSGGDETVILPDQLRNLQYLVERLLFATSVGAYKDLADNVHHSLKFGYIGTEGGAAPLSLDDRNVSYTAVFQRGSDGEQKLEFAIEGAIYDNTNSSIVHE